MAGPDERLRVVYDEAVRAALHVREHVRDQRAQATHVLAAASVVLTVLTGFGVGSPPVVLVRAGAFTLLALICVSIMLTPTDADSDISATVLLSGYVDATPPATVDQIRRDLTRYLDDRVDRTRRTVIARQRRTLRAAAVLLAICVAASLADLTGGLDERRGRPTAGGEAATVEAGQAGSVHPDRRHAAFAPPSLGGGEAEHRGLHPALRRGRPAHSARALAIVGPDPGARACRPEARPHPPAPARLTGCSCRDPPCGDLP